MPLVEPACRGGAVRLAAAVLVLACTLAAGCGAGERDGAPAWAGTRDTIDGVEVVRNPAEPLYDSAAVEVERLWTAPSDEEQERMGLWERPVRLAVAGGRVYVLDNLAHRVYVVDAETGEWLRAFGRRGGGPGEFERPFGIVVRDDRIAVGSGGGASIEEFDTAGEYLRTIRFDGVGFTLWPGSGDHYRIGGFTGPEGAAYHEIASDGTVEPVDRPEPATEPAYGLDDCSRSAASPDRMLRAACYEPVVYAADVDGGLTHELHIDRSPIEPDEATVRQHLDSVRGLMVESGAPAAMIDRMLEQERERFRFLPLYGDPRMDGATGHLVLLERMPRGAGSGGPPTAHILSAEGVFLASIEFDRVWTDYVVDGATLYVLERDPATDLTRLTAYRYRLPDGAEGGSAAESEDHVAQNDHGADKDVVAAAQNNAAAENAAAVNDGAAAEHPASAGSVGVLP